MAQHLLLILSLTFSTAAHGHQRKSGGRVTINPLIGTVKRVADGCGCYFRRAGEVVGAERYIFFEDASDGTPLMNIGGREVRLKLISSTEPRYGAQKKGERFRRHYAAGNVKIQMSFVATTVCPTPYTADCAANHYAVTVTASKGARRQTLKADGGCGC